MLSFATEFPVCDTDTARFVNAVRKWMIGSPHTAFAAEQLAEIPTEGRWKTHAQNASLEGLFATNGSVATAAFKHTVIDGSIEWITEVTYSKSDVDDWVGVRTARESSRPLVTLPAAKKPLLVRTLIAELGGGLDDELYVSDKPYYLNEQDTRMAIRLLNSDAENYLPLVYISSPFSGSSIISAEPLARVLGGMAHVIVEPSRGFSRSIQNDVGSRNVYGGNVGVYWPNGERARYFLNAQAPTEFDLRRIIASDIRAAHINRRPFGRCTWTRAEAEVARAAFEALRGAGSEDVAQYVAAFDSEMRAKNSQLSEAEAEVARLRSQIRSLESRSGADLNKFAAKSEQEFLSGEFEEILRDALLSAANNAQDGGRRQHVILAFANEISEVSNLKGRRESLKIILDKYREMTGETKAQLEKLGFNVSKDGKHYKLRYMEDDRYIFSLPKTGSDWRGGKNSVSDIGKRVF